MIPIEKVERNIAKRILYEALNVSVSLAPSLFATIFSRKSSTLEEFLTQNKVVIGEKVVGFANKNVSNINSDFPLLFKHCNAPFSP